MQLQVVKAEQLGERAASQAKVTLQRKPEAVFGLPTGHTPIPLYQSLLAKAAKGEVDLSRMRVAMLDDYLGARHEDEVSFYHWLQEHFLRAAGIGDDRTLAMPTQAATAATDCKAYEQRLLEWGGCDLLFLGLGRNGHIGFNEPGSEKDTRTRVVRLSAGSRAANADYWTGNAAIPEQGVTMGIGTILVAGEDKREILQRVLKGEPSAEIPASWLQQSPQAMVLADEAAAGRPAE